MPTAIGDAPDLPEVVGPGSMRMRALVHNVTRHVKENARLLEAVLPSAFAAIVSRARSRGSPSDAALLEDCEATAAAIVDFLYVPTQPQGPDALRVALPHFLFLMARSQSE